MACERCDTRKFRITLDGDRARVVCLRCDLTVGTIAEDLPPIRPAAELAPEAPDGR